MEPQRRELEYSRGQLSASTEDRTVFYIDDVSPGPGDVSPSSDCGPQRLAYPELAPRPRSQQQQYQRRRNSSVSSQCGSGYVAGAGRPRRQRRPSELGDHLPRRSSTSQPRPRANSCARPTPLGDGRRASVCKKPGSSRSRRASTGPRRDSIRPLQQRHQWTEQQPGSRSPSSLLTPTSLQEAAALKDPAELARARRHKRVALLLFGTFVFILAAAVFAVVVTLTHSSFHSPPVGSRELAQHRANVNDMQDKSIIRKENEELLNSLNRDSSRPINESSLPG